MTRLFCCTLAIIFVLFSSSGCSVLGPHECVCPAVFAMYRVYIQDSSHRPIDSLHTSSIDKRTGKIFSITQDSAQYPQYWPGWYIVLTDAQKSDLQMAGDTIIFHAYNARHDVHQLYVFGTDACLCGITKIAGPDTITTQ